MKNKNKLVLASICVLIIIHIAFVHCNKKYIEPLDNNSPDSESESKPVKAILKGKYINGKWCMDIDISFEYEYYDEYEGENVDNISNYTSKTCIDTTCQFPLMILSDECCPSNKTNNKLNKYSTLPISSSTKIKDCYTFSNAKMCERPDTNKTVSGLYCESMDHFGLSLSAFSFGTHSIHLEANEGLENFAFVTDAKNISAPPSTGFMHGAPFFTYLINKFNASNYTLDIGNGQLVFNDSIVPSNTNPGMPININWSGTSLGTAITITKINSTKFDSNPPEFIIDTNSDAFLTYNKNDSRLQKVFNSDNYNISDKFVIILDNNVIFSFPENVRAYKNSNVPIYTDTEKQKTLDNIIPSNKNSFGLGFLSNFIFNFNTPPTPGNNKLSMPAAAENSLVFVSKNYKFTTTGSGEGGGEMEYDEITAAFSITILIAFIIAVVIIMLMLFKLVITAFIGPFHSVYKHSDK